MRWYLQSGAVPSKHLWNLTIQFVVVQVQVVVPCLANLRYYPDSTRYAWPRIGANCTHWATHRPADLATRFDPVRDLGDFLLNFPPHSDQWLAPWSVVAPWTLVAPWSTWEPELGTCEQQRISHLPAPLMLRSNLRVSDPINKGPLIGQYNLLLQTVEHILHVEHSVALNKIFYIQQNKII